MALNLKCSSESEGQGHMLEKNGTKLAFLVIFMLILPQFFPEFGAKLL